jgi:C1A family cysteine protease
MATPIQVPKRAHLKPERVVPIPKPQQPFGMAIVPETGEIVGTGWKPEPPDLNDFTESHPKVVPLVEKLGIFKFKDKKKGTLKNALPAKVDLRPWCSEVPNQGNLSSCTAHAAAAILEYFENYAFNRHLDVSRLFIYKTTRELMGEKGDSGAFLRSTMAALVLFGAPPEKFWTYTTKKEASPANERTFDTEPTTFVYGIADNYESTAYFCHDPYENPPTPAEVLHSVKTYLAHHIPSMFGFWGFPSSNLSNVKGGIPYPASGEKAIWGHAVAAVGYNDTLKIRNLNSNKETTGALIFKNSWGASWGDEGFGYLPYDYVLSQFASDFWSLLNMGWVDTGRFGLAE